MPVELDPVIERTHQLVLLPGGGAATQSRFALAILAPVELESQESKATLLARVEPTETHQPGLFRGDRKIEFRQSLRQSSIEGLRLLPQLKGDDKVIAVPNQHCPTATPWLDHLLKPEIQSVAPPQAQHSIRVGG